MKPPIGGLKVPAQELLRTANSIVPSLPSICKDSIENLEVCEILGEGRFGNVARYIDKNSQDELAGLNLNLMLFEHWLQDANKVKQRFDDFIDNLKKLSNLSHEHILKHKGLYVDKNQIILFNEYCVGRSVKDKIKHGLLDDATALNYFSQTTEAILYLHSLNPSFVHTDIKSQNLLIQSHNIVKLSNFGLIRDLCIGGYGMAIAADMVPDDCTSLLYIAPEVLNSHKGPGFRESYEPPADIWSLGCVLVEMITGFPPYGEYFDRNVALNHLLPRHKGPEKQKLPYNSESLTPMSSDAIKLLVDRLFERNEKQRITAAELKSLLRTLGDFTNTKSRTATYDSVEHIAIPSTSNMNDLYNDGPTSSQTVIKHSNEDSDKESNEGYIPLETLVNGATRRTRSIHLQKKKKKKRPATAKMWICCSYYTTRITFFFGILSRAVAYILGFITIGVSALALFLLIALFIVWLARLVISQFCECDLMEPQYLVISGIFMILLFALLFSCCMVALGEYKFRKANKSLHKSRFWLERPESGVKMCGIPVIPAKKQNVAVEIEEGEDNELPVVVANTDNHDDFYL